MSSPSPFSKVLARLQRDWFLVGMLLAVVLASVAPNLGRTGGWLRLDAVTNVGIAIVFFLNGLNLPLQSLRAGLLNWRVHLIAQGCTFVVFPLLWLAARPWVEPLLPAGLGLGFAYLAALPSTVSSSVAMTAAARGNVPAAIFNATLSSLLGVVVTPLWVSVLAGAAGHGLPLAKVMTDIARLLLLPLLAGQLARPLLLGWFQRWRSYTDKIDRSVILLLVLAAFSDSVASGLWRDHGVDVIVIGLGGAALFLGVVLALSTAWARWWKLPEADAIAASFCGSKKTVASGVPMAQLMFGAHPALGLIVLPIMLYHQLQLFACSALAARYAARQS